MPEFTVSQLLALAKDALSNRPKTYKKGGTVEHKGVNITQVELSPQAVDGGAVFHPEHFAGGGFADDIPPAPIGHNMPPEPIHDPEPVEDYRGQHAAPGPDSGVPLHDTKGVYPPDFYGPNGFRYYADHGNDYDRDSYRQHARLKDKPNDFVWVYRAVPKDVHQKAMRQKEVSPLSLLIKKGDWVTPSKEYAKEHGESALNGKYKVVGKRVQAKDVYTNGDSIHEWGYYPERFRHLSSGGGTDDAEQFAQGGVPHTPHPAMRIPGVHIITAEAGEPIFHGDL